MNSRMRRKKDLLEEIGNGMDMSVTGADNFPHDTPVVVVANHTSMSDIFTVSHALPDASQIVLSSRLMWKSNTPESSARRKLIEESLYGIPLEVHGGKRRLELGLAMAREALLDSWPVVIFPEGAYTGKQEVTKGRTGAARLLLETRSQGAETQLLPVGVKTVVDPDHIDSTEPASSVHIVIGEPIDYSELHSEYESAKDDTSRRQVLRATTGIAMRAVAQLINSPYIDEHIPIRPRTTIILESGEEIEVATSEGTPLDSPLPHFVHQAAAIYPQS